MWQFDCGLQVKEEAGIASGGLSGVREAMDGERRLPFV